MKDPVIPGWHHACVSVAVLMMVGWLALIDMPRSRRAFQQRLDDMESHLAEQSRIESERIVENQKKVLELQAELRELARKK